MIVSFWPFLSRQFMNSMEGPNRSINALFPLITNDEAQEGASCVEMKGRAGHWRVPACAKFRSTTSTTGPSVILRLHDDQYHQSSRAVRSVLRVFISFSVSIGAFISLVSGEMLHAVLVASSLLVRLLVCHSFAVVVQQCLVTCPHVFLVVAAAVRHVHSVCFAAVAQIASAFTVWVLPVGWCS